jgi:septal ring factor EnvC (AmiA/AmiB activator)
MMLGDDQLLRKAWTAWMEAMSEAKQNQISDAVPKMQEMLKMHHNLIESEKSKLHSTDGRVRSLEADHTKLLEELQTLRKSLDLERSHWQGMTRGLQAAKKTMHKEGDGAMLPSATRLRNAMSPHSRPATSRTLSSLVCQLPSSS